MNFNKYFDQLPKDLAVETVISEIKFLKLFAFNAYFAADNLRTEDCNEGCTYKRKNGFGIDGVFLNESMEETTIELVYSYWVEENDFNINHAMEAISRIHTDLVNINKRSFVSGNKEAEDLITNYLEEADSQSSKPVLIRVITNYIPNEQDKFKLSKMVSAFNVSVRNLNVSAAISFGTDVEEVVESNIAPFDYVERDKLIIDIPNNVLNYDDHSFVCNVSAKSLKRLWQKEGQKGLLAMNLRYYIKSKNIDNKIENSIMFNYNDFWYLNNGIIIVCDNFNFVGNELRLEHFSIVNGGQTTRMIGEIPFENDFYICCKVIKNIFETSNDKNQFIANIAEATNTQKPIKAKDIIANKIEQRNLKSLMQDNKIFIEIKRGEKYNHEIYKEPWQRTKNNELAQDLYSFVYMEPGPARNSVSSILQNAEKYETIFSKHSYPIEFLRSLLFLEKAYREYSKRVSKDEFESPVKKGLIKNGLYYTLATIGYILKLNYNHEFRINMQKYQNNEAMYQLYSSELAFINAFVNQDKSYKTFLYEAFDVFNYVFENLIVPEFEKARSANPTLAYSNWMKNNPGFNCIRKRINQMIFDRKDSSVIQYVSKHFASINEEQSKTNIDLYLDYVKKNPVIRAKDNEGNYVSENDEALRNDLMIYRMNYALKSRKGEQAIFTDKMLDKLVIIKPISELDLKKIITSSATIYYCKDEILKIIKKYL